jgi:hypothetical protein
MSARFRSHKIGWLSLLGLIAISSVCAQYAYDPSADDEQGPGIRYFGSAKDENGSLMSGVSILIDSQSAAYSFVTDNQGRFRGLVSLDMTLDKVTLKCFKVGYELVRMNKRPGPKGPSQTVQVDCVLRSAKSG